MIATDTLEIFGIPKWLLKTDNTVNEIPSSQIPSGNISKKSVFCLVVEKQTPQSFLEKGATQNLLFKMLGAIGLNPTDIHCIAVDDEKDLAQQLKNIQAKKLLLMGDFQSNKDAFITPHPSEILQKPELKRIAWEELKQLKK